MHFCGASTRLTELNTRQKYYGLLKKQFPVSKSSDGKMPESKRLRILVGLSFEAKQE